MELTGGMIMKKQFVLIAAAVAALFAVSCVKENPVEDAPVQGAMKEVTITASIDEATKTSYDAEGVFSWTKGDKVSVLASDNLFYTFTAKTSGASTELVGQIPEGATLGRFAYFPASDNHTYDSSTWYSYYSIDEYKDLDGISSAEIPMYALKGENNTYAFKHLTGAAKLTFTNIPEGVDEVTISIKNEKCKFSGLWKVSTAEWGWSAASTTVDSELTFTRKIPVSNQTAQLYLPYKGGIWYSSTINIIGHRGDEELVILKDKVMKGNSTEFAVANVVPYAPLALPDYAPEVDWTTINWDAEAVATSILDPSSNKVELTELKAIADQYYLYFRVKALPSFTGTTFDYYIAGGEGTEKAHSYWSTTVSTTIHYQGTASNTALSVKYDDNNYAVTKTDASDDCIYWYVAFPRSAYELTKNPGTVYLGVYSLNANASWGCVGAIPTRYTELMPVVLN